MKQRSIENFSKRLEQQGVSRFLVLSLVLLSSASQLVTPTHGFKSNNPNPTVFGLANLNNEFNYNKRVRSSSISSLLQLRGGAIDDYSDTEYGSDSSDGSTGVQVEVNFSVDMGILDTLFKAIIRLIHTIFRTIFGVRGELKDTDDDEVALSLKQKSGEIGNGNEQEDFGEYLSSSYTVIIPDTDEDEENLTSTTIQGGSLTDALKLARSQGRLLAVFIPASKPSSSSSRNGKKETNDQIAIQSILSDEVATVAERKSRKKQTGGSFILWSTKANSSEATVAKKRLKVKKSKGNTPLLLVAYPSQSYGSNGKAKITPRVLAQHHCNPPPSSESMASWLNTLRKRHKKEYAIMQHELREMQLLKERNEGYTSSMKDDVRRKAEEKRLEEKRKEEERLAREEEEALKERREEFLATLAEEPESNEEGVMTLAIRFTDGRSEKRRFYNSCDMGTVFNWVDATFDVKRENLVLSSMRGEKSFSYEEDMNMTLEEAGLGKMAALRATIEEQDDDEQKEDSDAEEEDDTEDEEE